MLLTPCLFCGTRALRPAFACVVRGPPPCSLPRSLFLLWRPFCSQPHSVFHISCVRRCHAHVEYVQNAASCKAGFAVDKSECESANAATLPEGEYARAVMQEGSFSDLPAGCFSSNDTKSNAFYSYSAYFNKATGNKNQRPGFVALCQKLNGEQKRGTFRLFSPLFYVLPSHPFKLDQLARPPTFQFAAAKLTPSRAVPNTCCGEPVVSRLACLPEHLSCARFCGIIVRPRMPTLRADNVPALPEAKAKSSRTKWQGSGCFEITDKAECCGYYDPRAEFASAPNCVYVRMCRRVVSAG